MLPCRRYSWWGASVRIAAVNDVATVSIFCSGKSPYSFHTDNALLSWMLYCKLTDSVQVNLNHHWWDGVIHSWVQKVIYEATKFQFCYLIVLFSEALFYHWETMLHQAFQTKYKKFKYIYKSNLTCRVAVLFCITKRLLIKQSDKIFNYSVLVKPWRQLGN